MKNSSQVQVIHLVQRSVRSPKDVNLCQLDCFSYVDTGSYLWFLGPAKKRMECDSCLVPTINSPATFIMKEIQVVRLSVHLGDLDFELIQFQTDVPQCFWVTQNHNLCLTEELLTSRGNLPYTWPITPTKHGECLKRFRIIDTFGNTLRVWPVFTPGPERKALFTALMLRKVGTQRSFREDLSSRRAVDLFIVLVTANSIEQHKPASRAPYIVAGIYLAQLRKKTFLSEYR